jgi:hypothetical protein
MGGAIFNHENIDVTNSGLACIREKTDTAIPA